METTASSFNNCDMDPTSRVFVRLTLAAELRIDDCNPGLVRQFQKPLEVHKSPLPSLGQGYLGKPGSLQKSYANRTFEHFDMMCDA